MLSAIWWGGVAAAALLLGYLLAMCGLSNRTIGLIRGKGANELMVKARSFQSKDQIL
jgi:hypothetical protein